MSQRPWDTSPALALQARARSKPLPCTFPTAPSSRPQPGEGCGGSGAPGTLMAAAPGENPAGNVGPTGTSSPMGRDKAGAAAHTDRGPHGLGHPLNVLAERRDRGRELGPEQQRWARGTARWARVLLTYLCTNTDAHAHGYTHTDTRTHMDTRTHTRQACLPHPTLG